MEVYHVSDPVPGTSIQWEAKQYGPQRIHNVVRVTGSQIVTYHYKL